MINHNITYVWNISWCVTWYDSKCTGRFLSLMAHCVVNTLLHSFRIQLLRIGTSLGLRLGMMSKSIITNYLVNYINTYITHILIIDCIFLFLITFYYSNQFQVTQQQENPIDIIREQIIR